MTVIYIKSGATEESVYIGVETPTGREKFHIKRTEYARCGAPVKGEEIDEETYERIAGYHEYHKAVKKALSLLSYGDNNEKNLMRKLKVAGYSQDIARVVTKEMVSLGYIKEKDQLERLILAEANTKLQGPNKIFAKLIAKGYSSIDIREVMERLVSEGEINFKNNAYRLIEKKLPDGGSADEKKTLLYKNGYKI